ncbi:multidrug efflux system outer membrane protein [Sphingomonas jejuensis]|uniref:Multidrug efflux system outer membrane protein n=1 Tax=Sphingomonas jejuensis TaxID=904715 RepID=A0ABX0XP97_9SPHN|nr:efflux transporter outer membrane subunit [Sphingomonas jejuensis]NJC35033.1 multidrug efflux system outer membrane protein [Sphingomonas jejuensis]
MRKPFVVTAALLLAGCNLAPPHTLPTAPTPADYVDPSGVVPGVRATEIGWRDFFADPRLEALVAEALRRNRDLAVAVGRIEEARATYRIQDADRLPTIGGNLGASRTRTGTAGLGQFGGLAGGAVIPPVDGEDGEGDGTADTPSGFTFNQFTANVGVSAFELDFWGRVRNLSQAARDQYLATVEAERAFRLTLIRDVASAYLSAREADERIVLAQRTVESRQRGLALARRRFEAGVTSSLDFRQAEALLTQAETELGAVRLQRAQADNLLMVLVGGPTTASLPTPLTLAQQVTPTVAAGLPSELLVARPDVLQAELQLRASRANIGAARAAFFPSISLTGTLGFASNELGDLFTDRGFTYSVGPALSLPIFDWGRREAQLDVARARENIAVATYERTVQGAFQEVSDALAGRRYLSDQVAAATRAVEAQERIVGVARARYREGVSTFLEVLDAERELFTAQSALLQLRRQEALNRVSLYVALGGGLVEGAPAS